MNMRGLMAKGPPPAAGFLVILKIALAVLAFGVFVAACFNVAHSRADGFTVFDPAAGGLAIWTCLYTWGVLGAEFFLGMSMHSIYFRIVFIALLVLGKIFWLSTWADAASLASIANVFGCDDDDFCKKFHGSESAIAALGAFCWLLIIAIIVFYVLACLRDPSAGAPNYQPNNAYAGQPNAELGNIKHDGSQQPFVGGPPQQQYGQPQYGPPQPAPYQQ